MKDFRLVLLYTYSSPVQLHRSDPEHTLDIVNIVSLQSINNNNT